MPEPAAYLIFDIGKTNKKCILFSTDLHVLEQQTVSFQTIVDDDGDTCENIDALESWMTDSFNAAKTKWSLKGVNVSAYGATLVHIDRSGKRLLPVYDYLKQTPGRIAADFYNQFGGEAAFSLQTGSPALNMLNSGYQLYWLSKTKPEVFAQIAHSLHLPQYLTWLFTKNAVADISSIGCHTGMWDVQAQAYHSWLHLEHLDRVLPQAVSPFKTISIDGMLFGVGMHDSTAALLPYCNDPDTQSGILSSGTWNIFLVPGFNAQLTSEMFEQDCLYFHLDRGVNVAAVRLHLGAMVEAATSMLHKIYEHNRDIAIPAQTVVSGNLFFDGRTLREITAGDLLPYFGNYDAAYSGLIKEAAQLQLTAIRLLTTSHPIKRIYINGGFASNALFVAALRKLAPGIEFIVSEIVHASALGAAIALKGVPGNLGKI